MTRSLRLQTHGHTAPINHTRSLHYRCRGRIWRRWTSSVPTSSSRTFFNHRQASRSRSIHLCQRASSSAAVFSLRSFLIQLFVWIFVQTSQWPCPSSHTVWHRVSALCIKCYVSFFIVQPVQDVFVIIHCPVCGRFPPVWWISFKIILCVLSSVVFIIMACYALIIKITKYLFMFFYLFYLFKFLLFDDFHRNISFSWWDQKRARDRNTVQFCSYTSTSDLLQIVLFIIYFV